MYVADLGLFFCVAERAFRFPLSINLTEKKKEITHCSGKKKSRRETWSSVGEKKKTSFSLALLDVTPVQSNVQPVFSALIGKHMARLSWGKVVFDWAS